MKDYNFEPILPPQTINDSDVIDLEEIDNEDNTPLHLSNLLYKLRLIGKGHIRLISIFSTWEKVNIAYSINLPVKFDWENRFKIDTSNMSALKLN